MEIKKITMNQNSYDKSVSHLLTFAMETQQSTEAGGVLTLNPQIEMPKIEYMHACLTAILSGLANANEPFIPYKRTDIADMLDAISFHFRNQIKGPTRGSKSTIST